MLVFLAFSLFGASLAYNTNINDEDTKLCKQKVITFGAESNPDESINPYSFTDISKLIHNEAESNEILRVKFFYKGLADFSVAVSETEDFLTKPFFQTVVAYKTTQSAIFVERVAQTTVTPYCNHVMNFRNMFNVDYFEELFLIVTKDGVMSWYIPNQKGPFLRCTHPALKKIKYISFSGYDSKFMDTYFFDCPLYR